VIEPSIACRHRLDRVGAADSITGKRAKIGSLRRSHRGERNDLVGKSKRITARHDASGVANHISGVTNVGSDDGEAAGHALSNSVRATFGVTRTYKNIKPGHDARDIDALTEQPEPSLQQAARGLSTPCVRVRSAPGAHKHKTRIPRDRKFGGSEEQRVVFTRMHTGNDANHHSIIFGTKLSSHCNSCDGVWSEALNFKTIRNNNASRIDISNCAVLITTDN
jgi:hypothetical protein